MNQKDALMYFSLRQPIEMGHQTTHRYHIAKAAYSQQQWTVVQAELLALRQQSLSGSFQTAAYRREKLRVAVQLADFNDRLVETLRRRLEASKSRSRPPTWRWPRSRPRRPASSSRPPGRTTPTRWPTFRTSSARLETAGTALSPSANSSWAG